MTPLPLTRDLVLIGGGHAHALVLRMWGMDPLPGVRLTVINPDPVAPYTGMLPGYIAGHYRRDEMMIDLIRLARHAGARIVLGRASAIDRAARLITVPGRGPIAYDVASIDVGITSDLPQVAGFDPHGVAAKPLGSYAAAWEAFVEQAPPDPAVVIIGAGLGGVELALATAHRLVSLGRSPQITLVERDGAVLSGIGAGARTALLAHLKRFGVRILTGAEVSQVNATSVHLAEGRLLRADLVLSVAGARPQGWLADTGLALTDGFVTIGPTLQTEDPAIFAVGDCAHMSHAPRPKAGVFAVRQAPVLLHNLRAVLSGGALHRYRPQRDYLKLVSTGGKGAVADKWGLPLDGAFLWRWKDRIDRKFMAQFTDYPTMPAPALPSPRAVGLDQALGEKPLCGGCGAKLGASALTDALRSLPAPTRPEVLSGPGDDAAVLPRAAACR
jgi:selenide, water dikinase